MKTFKEFYLSEMPWPSPEAKQQAEELEQPTDHEEFDIINKKIIQLFKGKPLGDGGFRHVYHCQIPHSMFTDIQKELLSTYGIPKKDSGDYDMVIKLLHDYGSRASMDELELWKKFKDDAEVSKFLCPVIDSDETLIPKINIPGSTTVIQMPLASTDCSKFSTHQNMMLFERYGQLGQTYSKVFSFRGLGEFLNDEIHNEEEVLHRLEQMGVDDNERTPEQLKNLLEIGLARTKANLHDLHSRNFGVLGKDCRLVFIDYNI